MSRESEEHLVPHRTISTTVAASITPVSKPPIPDHELFRLIGRGSYGEVWLARSVVGTFRAVKVVYRNAFDRARPYEREFVGIQKFEPISRSHEGLVDILQIGRNEAEGYFYYVMELADDVGEASSPEFQVSGSDHAQRVTRNLKPETYSPRTLRHDLDHHSRLPLPECINLGLAMTSALAHLHERGLVHRDVKPSNIIFVGGVPKLADIGLVADVSEARSFVGTDGFIPPEGPGSPSADLYSLGKVLYESSTGLDRQDFPKLPPDLKESLDRIGLSELNEIIVKACAGEPKQRYASAEAMLTDLELIHQGQSVKRKRTSERRLKIAKGICAGASLFALVAASLLIFLRGISFDTVNPAYRLSKDARARKEYLEGDQKARRDTTQGLAQARDHFNRAIKIDPKFTMAYNGLFEVYIRGSDLGLSSAEVMDKLRAYASKLMELNPNLAEAHAAQAYLDFCDRNWDAAERGFLKAIQLNPNCAIAHNRYGFCLYTAGQKDKALAELLLADTLDPTRPRIKKNIGNVFYVKRDFHEAIRRYQQATNLEPSYPNAYFHMGCAYRALGDYMKAIDAFEKADLLVGKDESKVKKYFDEHRRAYENGGSPGYWSKCLAEAQATHDLNWQAICQASLGNHLEALTLLEQASATNDEYLQQGLLWHECFDPIHTNPRFIALLKNMGLKR